MRIVYLCNNWLGCRVLQWLRHEGEEIVGLITHPPERCKYGGETRELVRGTDCVVLDGSRLRDRDVLKRVAGLQPEIGVSVLFGYILRREFLELFTKGCINLHPALLPYNRGAYPNVWSIVDGTPAGVSLHHMDDGLDTGDIIAQKEIVVSATDTGESLYHKLEEAGLALFRETWPLIRSGNYSRMKQGQQTGSSHRVQAVELIDEIDLQRSYKAAELLNILRARTFPPHPGAYFLHEGRRIYLRLQLLEESELSGM